MIIGTVMVLVELGLSKSEATMLEVGDAIVTGVASIVLEAVLETTSVADGEFDSKIALKVDEVPKARVVGGTRVSCGMVDISKLFVIGRSRLISSPLMDDVVDILWCTSASEIMAIGGCEARG